MKVILATDGTKYSETAAEILRQIKIGPGDVIKVVCVIDMAMPLSVDSYGGFAPDTDAIEKAAREHAVKVIEDTLNQLGPAQHGAELLSDILFGSPDRRIIETAEEMQADLIVIGSHGYNRWERLLLGSVSNSVVQHAHCSVLIARRKDS
jgi:nucleotide-binding universal stress UspA family protein